MSDPSLLEIMQALAGQIGSELCGTVDPLIPDLQVAGSMNVNPTPPSIDVYPADPFQEGIGFGRANNEMFLTVRARVNTPDHEGAQELLLSLMDPRSDTSVAQAILSDRTLGSKVEDVVVTGPSDFGVFVEQVGPSGGAFLGCTWTARVTP